MLKAAGLSIACGAVLCSSISAGEREAIRNGYNRYDNYHSLPQPNNYDRYDQSSSNVNYPQAIDEGILLNNQYNPDVRYTQPGSTDNFEAVYEQNNR